MESYLNKLSSYQEKLESLLAQLEKKQAKYSSLPDVHVRVCSSNGSPQYHLTNPKTSLDKYADKTQRKLVRALVQREYEERLMREIKSQLSIIARFQLGFDPQCLTTILRKFPIGKQKLILPVEETDEDYVRRWISEHPGGQNKDYEDGEMLTNRGELVRSKSEKIIADLLAQYDIPYAYESELRLRRDYVVHPDFVVLNVRTRKTIYWEHFGRLDDADYTFKNMRKLKDYDRAGYVLGEDLIITMETKKDVIDVRSIEEKIRRYCL